MDLTLLRERYQMREWYQKTRMVNLSALTTAIMQSDLVFGWFASWHTFFPMLIARALRHPSVLVVGGYDTANLPEIGYGSQRGGFKRWVSRQTMQWATRVVAFSEFSRQETIQNAGIAPNKVTRAYIGVEDRKCPFRQKEQMVITAGNVDRSNLQRKGLKSFVRTASHFPDIPFALVGAWRDDTIDYLRSIASPNVQFTGWVSAQALDDYFSRARVYVQTSRHEGFGLAVAEAMLRECVPVVTRAGSLPEVVGDTGVYLDSTEPAAVAQGIRQALADDDTLGKRGRERILREFPLERRRAQLFALVDNLIAN